ncbi:MAG: MFS transporter [Solirubrobacteraceae bacterium]
MAFAGFSAFAGLSGSIGALIVARCLMDLATAVILPATLAILSHTFTDAKERAAGSAFGQRSPACRSALGPVAGGLLLQHFSWGSVFFVSVPIAAVAHALGEWLVPTSRDPSAKRLDVIGFVLSIVVSARLSTPRSRRRARAG